MNSNQFVPYKNYIDGRFQDSESGHLIPVENPATGEQIGSVWDSTIDDASRAVDATHCAFYHWKEMNVFERCQLLRRSADCVERVANTIALMLSTEQGKPYLEALGEVMKGVNILRFYAEEGERVEGRIISSAEQGISSYIFYEPVGPCLAISPWNYPIELLAWKIGAALASGCTLLCKIPSETPLSPLLFIAAIVEVGYPPGVLNAICGRGDHIGSYLVSHPLIRKISFTGSTRVGRSVAKMSSEGLKRVSLELGGSLPMLVFNNCDLDLAIQGATRRSFRNMGQICIAVNRVYVQRLIYDEFLERFAHSAQQLTIGHGAEDACDLGAMCTVSGLERTVAHIEDAKIKGGYILTGGKKPEGKKFENGLFFEPTIIADATHHMRVMQEETFGPLVGIMPFDTIDEAIHYANDSPYGLAAMIYTSDILTAKTAIAKIESGNIALNNPDPGVINAPYGGWKESGYGYEHGREGLHEFLRIKHVRVKS